MSFITAFYELFTESAPYLILGLFIAGLMKALIPMQWMQRQLGGDGIWHIVKAAFIGAPLPLCSCGVLPAAMGLRRAGASKRSTISFLVATPETGADSITLSWVLLGPFMAIVRPIAAIVSAITAGLLVSKSSENQTKIDTSKATDNQTSGCCASAKRCGNLSDSSTSGEALSDSSKESSSTKAIFSSLKNSLEYAFTQLLNDIAFWLIIGLAAAALMQAYVPMTWFASFGDSIWLLFLMAVIGVPMYICASASTPIAAGLLATGISPGAILVFMLAGPATNIGSIAIIRKELGQSALVGYLVGVIGTAILSGILVNNLVSAYDLMPTIEALQAHQHDATWIEKLMSIILLLLTIRALVLKNARIKSLFSRTQPNLDATTD
jgi:uncharacterized protein